MGCIYSRGVSQHFSLIADIWHCWTCTIKRRGRWDVKDTVEEATHWRLVRIGCWGSSLAARTSGMAMERERELARMLANWATKQIELAEAQSSNTNLIWADLAWFHSSPPRAQVLPQQPQFHVGPGCLWTRQPFCNNGNCIWWDVPGQKRFDDPRLDCSWLQNVAWLTYYT